MDETKQKYKRCLTRVSIVLQHISFTILRSHLKGHQEQQKKKRTRKHIKCTSLRKDSSKQVFISKKHLILILMVIIHLDMPITKKISWKRIRLNTTRKSKNLRLSILRSLSKTKGTSLILLELLALWVCLVVDSSLRSKPIKIRTKDWLFRKIKILYTTDSWTFPTI